MGLRTQRQVTEGDKPQRAGQDAEIQRSRRKKQGWREGRVRRDGGGDQVHRHSWQRNKTVALSRDEEVQEQWGKSEDKTRQGRS
jgi:hypothetical protein